MSPLDFKDIATWKKIDLITACGRISGPLPGTLKVAIHVFHTLKDDAESRGQFFLNCETSGLVEDSLWDAYKEYCKGDIPKLITCMLKCDEAMLQAVKSKDAKWPNSLKRAAAELPYLRTHRREPSRLAKILVRVAVASAGSLALYNNVNPVATTIATAVVSMPGAALMIAGYTGMLAAKNLFTAVVSRTPQLVVPVLVYGCMNAILTHTAVTGDFWFGLTDRQGY